MGHGRPSKRKLLDNLTRPKKSKVSVISSEIGNITPGCIGNLGNSNHVVLGNFDQSDARFSVLSQSSVNCQS